MAFQHCLSSWYAGHNSRRRGVGSQPEYGEVMGARRRYVWPQCMQICTQPPYITRSSLQPPCRTCRSRHGQPRGASKGVGPSCGVPARCHPRVLCTFAVHVAHHTTSGARVQRSRAPRGRCNAFGSTLCCHRRRGPWPAQHPGCCPWHAHAVTMHGCYSAHTVNIQLTYS